jgi:hypothetical protein
MHLQTELGGDDLGGLQGASEIARVDAGESLAPQLFGERARLRSAAVVEGRVRVALPTSLTIPVRLAVTGEEQRRHAV